MDYRVEKDSMGEIRVPSDRLWGAQTQRSWQNFRIGDERIPTEVIKAFAILKKAAAITNSKLGKLDSDRADAISRAADEVIQGQWNEEFPLVVWQTGSGTQSNMNMNEVLAHRAGQIVKDGLNIHPNDHVNMSQSSNDTFPTAMHIAAVVAVEDELLPALRGLKSTLSAKSSEFADVVKTGRTHLQDATPLTVGQEISGWERMLERCESMILMGVEYLKDLALGGTAVGTGLNAHPDFGKMVAAEISDITTKNFQTAPNKFHSLTSKDEFTSLHGTLKALAADLMKIANDVRWLSSGPRCGIGEFIIPANEPGSSIMPGKVNPTQCEAVTMVAVQVMGNDCSVGFAASQGNFELNVFMPVLIFNFLQSVRLLADVMKSFDEKCVSGITLNREKIDYFLKNSLMLVTALSPYIGYDKAAQIAKKANAEGLTLRESAIALEFLSGEDFDRYVRPEMMTEARA